MKYLYIIILLTFGLGQDYSLSFDGDGDYVDVGNPQELQITSAFSVAVWVKNETNGGDPGKVITKAADYKGWRLKYYGGSDTWVFALEWGSSTYWDAARSSSGLGNGEWHYIVGVFSADGTGAKIYIDGYDDTHHEGDYLTECIDSNGPLLIGARPVGVSGAYSYYNGSVDNVSIWNVALTEPQIQSYMSTSPIGDENNLVGYWNMNEGEGDTPNYNLIDNSGNGNNGTIYGATWSTDTPTLGCTDSYVANYDETANVDDGSCTYPDNKDYSLSFDGVDDYIGIVYNDHLNSFSDALTVSVWVKVNSGNGTHRNIITNGLQGGGFALTVSDQNNFRPHIENQLGWLWFDSNTTVENDIWYHVLFIYDSQSFTLYVNGQEDGSSTNLSGDIINYNGDLLIGKYPNNENQYFLGNIDNIYIWDTALTQQQIQSNIYGELIDSEESLVGYYKFNAGSGDILYDHSGNQNHGTINGARWVTNGTKHVAEDGSDETGNGSADSPFGSIQYGIDMASEGDSVLVSAGTYYENINFNGKNIALIGEDRETTIIDGNQNGSVVTFNNGESTSANLSGFTITNGNAVEGGGIYINDSEPLIEDCIMKDNQVSGTGGGIFSNNRNDQGATDISLVPIIKNCLIYNNSALVEGGGLKFYYSNGKIINCTIANNNQNTNSAIAVVISVHPVEITNTIIYDNNGEYQLTYINPYTNDYNWDVVKYSNIQGGFEGEGNIDTDPLFTDPENGDFTLQITSPCIDAGDSEILDPDGSRSDMGAYYFPQESNTLNIDEGANLMSFSVLPRNGLDDLSECIVGIIGAGVAATNLPPWSGSLQELNCEDGYWLLNECEDFEWDYFGIPCSDSLIYNLIEGANLISYSNDECGSLSDVLPDEVEDCLSGIIGQGVASNNMPPWMGSLNQLCPNNGYWFISNCEIDFQYDEPTTLARLETPKTSLYPYNQSSQQAFYFIESIENIEQGDIIHTYYNDINVGSRMWNGSFTDVPAMGDDGSKFTAGYCKSGSIPTLKVEKANGSLITLTGDIPEWSNNQIYMVGYLEESIALPAVYSLSTAYPNPFNPTTTLSFAIPVDSEVFLSVYNLQGREVSTLIEGNMDAGYHSVVWNADAEASGVYFVKMVAGEYINTQKLMLIK